MIATELGRYMTRDDMAALQERAKRSPGGGMPPRKSLEQGAATTVWAATDPDLDDQGGTYLADCQVTDQHAPWARDPEGAARLWALSENLVGEKFPLEENSGSRADTRATGQASVRAGISTKWGDQVATRKKSWIARVGVITVVAVLAAMVAPGVARGAPSVRGFSDGTITVAGIGIAAQFDPGASIGAQARFKRANDNNEVKGIKIDYKEFADDQQDPAKSLTESRRLVTQVGVFAIVPDLSDTNAGAYFNQQHVPYFGWAFDDTYCSPKPTTALYGFGFNGCLVPATPKKMPGIGANQLYDIVSKKTGKKDPTSPSSRPTRRRVVTPPGSRPRRTQVRASRSSTPRARSRRRRWPTTRPTCRL